MKNIIKRLACGVLGHKDVEEIYAERRTAYRGRHPIHFFRVVTEISCRRCGKVRSAVRSPWMRRSEMLKNGWFIEKKCKTATQKYA